MSRIDVNNLTFAYEGNPTPVFSGVTFQLDTEWKCGLIGRNGRGKTTFLRLLSGALPDGGAVRTSVLFDTFPYYPPDQTRPALDIARSLIAPYDAWEADMNRLATHGGEEELLRFGELQESMIRLEGYRINELIEAETGRLGFPPRALGTPFDTLSGGERTKLLITALFLKSRLLTERFLLIDEPTNHLDVRGRELLQAYLASQKGFLLVSHDRELLDGVSDHIVSVNKQSIDVQQGNYSSWKANHDLQEAAEYKKNEQLKGEITRLNEVAKRTAEWSDKIESTKIGSHSADRGFIGAQSARVMKKSKNAERRALSSIEEKEALLTDIDVNSPLKLTPLAYPKPRLIELMDVTIDYGGGPLFAPLTASIMRSERVALTGGNGTGKSSLLKMILGADVPHTGSVVSGSNIIISYVSQETSHAKGTPREWALSHGLDMTLFMTILRKFGFSREQLEYPIENASEGQRKKILLASSLCERAHLYIWDEPLNYVDLMSREQIEDLILRCTPTMIFVEHDRRFLHNVVTRTIGL
ncbi:Lsa family ABC-F type ribosomal protection protein [Clostridia bacterium]|nr:Lsa family ABC-F type ribosomal protection protein [Clostridia bacterium]